MSKVKFSEFLREYREAELGNSFDVVQLRNFIADEDNWELLRNHLVIPGEKDAVIFEYTFPPGNDKVFILANRKDYDDIIGYMFIKKMNVKNQSNLWMLTDISIFKKYQNKGLGTQLHKVVIENKFDLINGYSLSKQARAVWENKLKTLVNMQIINIKTGQVEEYSDKDNSISDADQEWFCLATSTHQKPTGIMEHAGISTSLNISYERWLKNDPTYKMNSYTSSYYGEEGEF